jgi:16S rRNA (cytidine1402-2'-O)-methyltransferase
LSASLAGAWGARKLTVCRELTKQFESIATMPADQLPAWLAADANRVRGEFVLVLHGQVLDTSDDDARASATLQTLLAELPLKQAVSLAASLTGQARNVLYEHALRLKRELE